MAHTKVVIGDATLYHGDCGEVLMSGVAIVDIVVTSPPYNQLGSLKNIGNIYNKKWAARAARGYDDSMPEADYQKWLIDIFDKCRAKTKGLIWVNHKIRFRQKAGIHPARIFPYPIHSEIIWDRMNGATMRHSRFIQSHEHLFGFGTPHYWNPMHDALLTVWRISAQRNGDSSHPCSFPEDLIRPIIIASCPIGGTVLDNFMGIGTTGMVAIKNQRKFIGIEKEKKYFDKACRNIEAAYKLMR